MDFADIILGCGEAGAGAAGGQRSGGRWPDGRQPGHGGAREHIAGSPSRSQKQQRDYHREVNHCKLDLHFFCVLLRAFCQQGFYSWVRAHRN